LPVMLVQVGATSPPLRPAPMTKLDLLLQQAEVSVRSALIGTREQLRPLFHMIHANGQESLTSVPWRDEGEKETTLALVRALMRAGDVVAYSILNEAWSATPAEGRESGEPLPTAPNEGPDRLEVVIAAAYNRRRRKAATWRIERDADGRLHRPRPHGRRRRHGRPDAEITFPHTLVAALGRPVAPFARRRAIVGRLPGPSQDKARRPSQAGRAPSES
jgi:hypothetical protein